MGIIFKSNYDYSEYGTNKLFKKLEKDSLYCLSMFVCLGNASTVSIKGVDALFSSKRIKVFTLKNLSYKYKPDLKLGDSYITNKKKWIKISGIYKAKGGEKYLTIGNFTKTDSVIFPKLLSQSKIYEGYLLIDDVSLIPIHDSSQCDCNIKRISIETIESDSMSEGDRKRVISAEGTILSLNNLYFDTDSYEIKPESFEELNKLYNLLVSRPELKITVNGYTDNTGSYKHNLRLSQQRAKAVVDYLIRKGIEKERLKYIGYGEDNPIRTNETEEGRAANRRIEVEFIR
jgi:outer membrane protein OmpA-like peptidoglycan-associated protein